MNIKYKQLTMQLIYHQDRSGCVTNDFKQIILITVSQKLVKEELQHKSCVSTVVFCLNNQQNLYL